MAINVKSPAGRDAVGKFMRVIGYIVTSLGLIGFIQTLVFDKSKPIISISGTFFFAMIGLFLIASKDEVFLSRKLISINLINIFILYFIFYIVTKGNVAGGIVGIPMLIALYLPSFVLVRDFRETKNRKIESNGFLKIAEYLYYLSVALLTISVFITSVIV